MVPTIPYAPGSTNKTDSKGILDSYVAPKQVSATVTIVQTSDLEVDFGFLNRVTVVKLIYDDSNGNGVQDAGEEPISGVLVYLYLYTNGTLNPTYNQTTTTDSSGQFSFNVLPNATFTAIVDLDQSNGAILGGFIPSPYNPIPGGSYGQPDDFILPTQTSPSLVSIATGTINGTTSDTTLSFGFVE